MLTHSKDQKTCFFGLSFFPNTTPEAPMNLRSQFREREKGDYAMRYLDAKGGWSNISNVLYDNGSGAATNYHEFDIRILGSGSFGPVVTTGLTVVEIRDPYAKQSQKYTVNQKGLSLGAPAGYSEPSDDSWVRFQTRRHVHLKDFAHMGVHILSQGFAIKGVGISRMEMMIYDSESAALIKDRDANVAGPINLDGYSKGLEANLLSKAVGSLDPIN